VDGLIFQRQQFGGITRTARTLLDEVAAAEPNTRLELLLTGPARSRLPATAATKRLLPIDLLWPASAFLRERLLGRSVRGRDVIWHSFYYSRALGFDGPTVVTVHDMAHEKLPALFTGLRADLFRRRKAAAVREASAVVCVSEATRHDLLEFLAVDPSRVHIVPHAVDAAFTRSRAVAESGSLQRGFLLYVGGRHAYKNFAGLLNALTHWDAARKLRLVVVGAPPTREERARVRDAGMAGSVTFAGPVDDAQLAGLYHTAAAFVLPSFCEGFGLPLLEAMAARCPVAASRIPSTLEVAGDFPFYFDPASEESMVSALQLALAEPRDSERLRDAQNRVSRFSWAESAGRMLAIYDEVAPAGRQRAGR
jgi:glycosyltransferase involved in cell wall biosynthesis